MNNENIPLCGEKIKSRHIDENKIRINNSGLLEQYFADLKEWRKVSCINICKKCKYKMKKETEVK